jgi:hypothetical protein
MIPLAQAVFDIYALALPRGHGFGTSPPTGSWQSDDGQAFGVVRHDEETARFGVLALRRRTDGVWAVVLDRSGLETAQAALEVLRTELDRKASPAPVPPGVPRRPPLFDLGGREPSRMIQLLAQPSHINVARLLNELYLALPKPDRNWASDCRGENFHTRLWEAQLLASFREQGLHVEQPYENPDFRIENRLGDSAWVEAVTANPPERYEPVDATPPLQPDDVDELFFGKAALRFAKTIGNKLGRRYDALPHVAGAPSALAVADFHAPGSMVWSREALIGYLYAISARPEEIDGRRVPVSKSVTHLLGASGFPAGLLANDEHAELSAIIFTNACTTGKFNRMMVSAGAPDNGLRYTRYGKFYDRRAGVVDGIPFCLDVRGEDYRRLWPQRTEPWCAELEVFHNPFARHPLPRNLLPEATHWIQRNGEIVCRSHYKTNILWSRTLIQKQDAPVATYDTIASILAGEAQT